MTSPDLPSAVSLELHRVSEVDILDAEIASLQLRVPEWIPGEGHSEAVIMEAVAVAVAQDVYAVNQLPRVVFSQLLATYGVGRLDGYSATGTIRITITSGVTGTRTLPAGTRFRVRTGDGGTVDLITGSDQTINPSDTIVYAPVTAEYTGVYANGLLANTSVDMPDALSWIESALLFTTTTGGTDVEPDPAYFSRGAAFLRRQNSALVLAEHFQTFTLEAAGVGRARAIDRWDSVGAVGGQVGHITVAAATLAGAALSGSAMAALQSTMAGKTMAGLQVHVVPPHFVDMAVTVTVIGQPGVDKPTLTAGLTAMLKAWISPGAWPWGGQIYRNDLITRVQTFPGVLRVTATGGAGVDSPVTDPVQLPALTSTVGVTVT